MFFQPGNFIQKHEKINSWYETFLISSIKLSELSYRIKDLPTYLVIFSSKKMPKTVKSWHFEKLMRDSLSFFCN